MTITIKAPDAPRLNFCLWLGETSLSGGLICGTEGAIGPSDAKGSFKAASPLNEYDAARLGAYAACRQVRS